MCGHVTHDLGVGGDVVQVAVVSSCLLVERPSD